MNTGLAVTLIIVALIVGTVVGFLVSAQFAQKTKKSAQDFTNKAIADAQAVLSKASSDSKEIITKAHAESKDILIDTKERVAKDKEAFNKELREGKAELKLEKEQLRQEKQSQKQREDILLKKEESIDKKLENIEDIKQKLIDKENLVQLKQNEVEQSHEKMLEAIERVANLSREEAKKQLVASIEEEAKKDAVKLVKAIEYDAKEEGDAKAKDILVMALQRCGVEVSQEVAVSVVDLPNDELKGRIIGREGRNIRTLEQVTGVDFIVDDTPGVIVLSSFDPIRREVARLVLEKLISDGRIHPTRIEELVEKIRKELEVSIKKAGEDAVREAGIFGMHPDLVKIAGRLKYRTSYGQNILRHSVECAHIAAMLAQEIGADVNLARRGAFLHDIGKALDHETEGTHVSIGVELGKKYKESLCVINCIESHHGDVEPICIEAIISAIADAVSGSRPGARRDSFDHYVKRLEKLEEIANNFKGVEKCFALQAGREIRVIVKPEEIDETKALYMAKDIARQIESEMEYPGQIKVNVIREVRSVEYAK